MGRTAAIAASCFLFLGAALAEPPARMDLGALARVATVDERFQSYNVEMVEVTGGRFWAPYGGPDDEVYRARPPLDLTDPRLIAFARQLAPAYMRVSGTWSRNTYLEAEGEHLSAPPAGFAQILTRRQWRDAIAFSRAADAPIVTSFAVSAGTRGPDGVWRSDQAQRLAELTRDAGGAIAAAEFFNEPNIPGADMGLPAPYSADAYAADFRVFRDWARTALPTTKLIGPGSVGEGRLSGAIPANARLGARIASEDMMRRTAGNLDAVSYHFYGSVSQRCRALGIGTAAKEVALTPAWLDATLREYDFYAALRDKYEPGRPIWNTETAQAACGGSPWASTFLDTFRYLNQNGALAQRGVQVVMHNTLATSDYALIDRDTMTARPNYWAAVLWKRTMGATVLAAPAAPAPDVRLYAHCLPERNGGVGLMALNLGATRQTLHIGARATAWVMTGRPLDTRDVRVNGAAPAIDADGAVTGLDGRIVHGVLAVPGQAIAFAAIRGAHNPACR